MREPRHTPPGLRSRFREGALPDPATADRAGFVRQIDCHRIGQRDELRNELKLPRA
jgi:hypothetical protein